MKRIVSVLTASKGALATGAIAGSFIADPTLAARVEAWVIAGVALAADVAVSYLTTRFTEGR